MILGISGSFLITPKYKSVAVVYPSNLIPYGIETPTEQLLQLLESDDIRENLIRKFDLFKHYNIDSTRAHAQSRLIETFNDNVSIEKTEFESVKIEVLDKNPKIASEIASSLIDLMNEKARALQRSKSNEIVIMKRKSFLSKKQEVDSMEAKLKELRVNYGLLDYNLQTEYTTEAYLKLLSGSSSQQVQSKQIEPLIANLQEKGGEFQALNENLRNERYRYNLLKVEYENSLNDITKELTYANLVTRPVPADKKSYPIRWIIALGSLLCGLTLSFLVIIYQQRKDELSNLFKSNERAA